MSVVWPRVTLILCYTGNTKDNTMANLTISVDDDLLRRARVRAARLGTSVNAVLRQFMESWAGGKNQRAQAVASLLKRSSKARSARAGRAWTRDELHER